MGLSSKERDRLTSERKRLAVIWQTLAPEQQEMRKQSERLNTLTKELESLRDEVGALEEACKLAGYYTDSGSSGMRAMFENAMAREGVLVETCKVENLIKGALDITESLLGREKRKLHKELERVRMEKFWNLADGLRKRNPTLSPVETMWIDEENKIDNDVIKVRDLRNICWQRMHVDAQKLDDLRAWERARQERQEREDQKLRERQERQRKERQRQQEEYDHYQEQQRQQQQYHQRHSPPKPKPAQPNSRSRQEPPRASRPTAGPGQYSTDGGARGRPHTERKPPYARPEGTTKKMSEGMQVVEAWREYQHRWNAMTTAVVFASPLTYSAIPWPVLSDPIHPASLTPERIAHFLLSAYHSAGKGSMDRLRDAMKLWHPDKWEGRLMSFVGPGDQAAVRESVGMVARGLIELMRVQKKLHG